MRMKNLLLKNVFSRYNVSVPSSIQLFFYNSTKIAFLQVAQLTYMTKVSQGLAIISDEDSKGLITAYLVLSGEAAAKRVNTSISRRRVRIPSRAYKKKKKRLARRAFS